MVNVIDIIIAFQNSNAHEFVPENFYEAPVINVSVTQYALVASIQIQVRYLYV